MLLDHRSFHVMFLTTWRARQGALHLYEGNMFLMISFVYVVFYLPPAEPRRWPWGEIMLMFEKDRGIGQLQEC
jgi:hypothetical protein